MLKKILDIAISGLAIAVFDLIFLVCILCAFTL